MAVPYVRTAACLARMARATASGSRSLWVLHCGSVAIARLDAGDMAPAVRVVRFERPEAVRPASPEVVLGHGGRLWTAPEMQRAAIPEGRLDALLDNPDAVAFLLYGGTPPWPRGAAVSPMPRWPIEDGREAAEHSLRLAAGDAAIADGVVHRVCAPPSLVVVPGPGRTGKVALSTERRPGGYAFAPDRRHALERFVEACVGPGGFSEVEVGIRAIEHGTGACLTFPEARHNARHALVSALSAIREALPRLDAASLRQLAEIARLREGIESGEASPAEADAALGELDELRPRMGASHHLGHAIRIGRAAIALSRPEPIPADEAALSTLVP